MEYNDIIETIERRKSVRSYTGEPLSPEMEDALRQAIDQATDPFGGKVTIRLKYFDLAQGYKPSTYGMIKGATNFFLLGIGDDQASALSAGYRFEQVVLKACEMGLGTCWIAATFKGSDFERGEEWPDGEELKIISPVGYPAKVRMLEKMGRMALGSDKRKPFDELFFADDFRQPLSRNNRFAKALEMLRLAPSSTNSQPWRALVVDEMVHFFYKPKSAASVLDCGIGLCHFDLTERSQSRTGEFFTASETPTPPEDWRYLISYREA